MKPQQGSLAAAWNSSEFWTENAIGEFIRGLRRVMGKMKQKELAARLGMSESAVSQVLNGAEDNYTLERMNRIAGALDAAVHVHVAPRNSIVRFTEQPTGPLGEIYRGKHEPLPFPHTDTSAAETVGLNNFKTGTEDG